MAGKKRIVLSRLSQRYAWLVERARKIWKVLKKIHTYRRTETHIKRFVVQEGSAQGKGSKRRYTADTGKYHHALSRTHNSLSRVSHRCKHGRILTYGWGCAAWSAYHTMEPPLSCRFPLANIKWSSDTSGESPNALTPWSSGRPVRSQVQPCEWHIARVLSRRRIITRLLDKLRQWKIKRQLDGKQLCIGKERDFSPERYWGKLFFKFVLQTLELPEIFSKFQKIFKKLSFLEIK